MSAKLILEILVLLGALLMGARAGGVGLGLWGAVGLLVLVVVFGVPPGAVPGEVLIIVLTVIMAASAMEAWSRRMPTLIQSSVRFTTRWIGSTGTASVHT